MSLIRTLTIVALLAGLTPLLVVAAAGLSGVGHRWVDILAQFTAPAAAAAVLVALLLTALRAPQAAGVAVIVALILVIAAWPQWSPGQARPAPGAPTARVYLANLYVLNDDVDAIAASVRAARPDVVVFIELGDEARAGLDAILPDHPHRIETARYPGRRGGGVRTVLASSRPLVRVRPSPGGAEWIAARVQTPLGPMTVMGVHLTRPWPFVPHTAQISQAERLVQARAGLPDPLVVVGDFNSVASANIGRIVTTGAGLVPAPGFPGTWPATLPGPFRITIDQLYRSPDLVVTRRALGRPTGSDHRPVVVDLSRARSGD